MGKTACILAFMTIFLFSCNRAKMEKESRIAEDSGQFMEKGSEIVSQSFAALAGQLSKAMKEGGVQNAVNYCHLKANLIMDSLSNRYNAKIERVTLKPRNPENLAKGDDATILFDYQQAIDSGEEIMAFVLTDRKGGYTYYAPITVISPLCLSCHGVPGETMNESDYNFIRSRYPHDKATGYKEKDLRGMWKVIFKEEGR